MSWVKEELERIGDSVRYRFEAEKRVLSFEEYLEMLLDRPDRYARDAPGYLRDCFLHYGSYEVNRPWGPVRRFRLFDPAFEEGLEDEGLKSDHLVGHEALQEQVYGVLNNFVREGRPNRLILLHGPNGSAKTTFTRALMRGLEHYSNTDEGALYRFSWVFPRGKDGKAIGFGSVEELPAPGRSYAHLPDAQIEVKLQSEIREHPCMLLPIGERRDLLRQAYAAKEVGHPPPDWLWSGQLGHKNQQVFQALLTAYRGDLRRVLSHVQVERYYISRRYRVGAVTIGPEMAVDASERQITADRTLGGLPASLSSVTLFESYGELVDASGGIVDYSDLLKRPLDAWKYLLLAIENGEVALQMSNLPLNTVMLGSSNEVHLAAFKEHHEYNSFRGRLQLVRVPYLLDYEREQGIYDSQIVPQVRCHVSPHATRVAALWAVLTRLRRAQSGRFESSSLGRVAADLTPMEKADFYHQGVIPRRLPADDARELAAGAKAVFHESEITADYEGLTGVSPREIRTLLLDAANDRRYACLSPRAVLDRIEDFCERNDYEFLKQTPERGYQDHRVFVRQVHERWLDYVDEELRSCTGLVEEAQYLSLFEKYVTHVSFQIKGEKIFNEHTDKSEDPDEELMRTIEEKLAIEGEPEAFRKNLINTVAGHAIDHPGEKLDFPVLFPRYIERLREAYYGERRRHVGVIGRDIIILLDEGPGLTDEAREVARQALDRLERDYGYQNSSARLALGELIEARYPK